MEQYEVTLLNFADNSETNVIVYADEAETTDNIFLKTTIDSKELISESEQYLSAYQMLRDQLLQNGFGLKCNGSLINANQSAMMSYTPKIYLVCIGKQATMKDVVNIWGYCDTNDFPTTEQQNLFIQDWFASL